MREKLIELIQSAVSGCARYWAELIADRLIAAGVVVPVRCKDCKKWDAKIGSCEEFTTHRFPACGRITFLTREDDYCSYGERRTDG